MTPTAAPSPPRPAPPAARERGGTAEPPVAAGYRRFLLGTAAAVYVGAAVELYLVGHYHGWTQVVPFVLIALGLASVLWARARAGRRSLGAVRAASALVVAGSVLGVGLHVKGNLAFEREVHPDAPLAGAVWEAARGASPLLAPGALALAGVLAAAAAWRHPALGSGHGARG